MRDDTYQPKNPGLIELMRLVSGDPSRTWTHDQVAKVIGCEPSPSVVHAYVKALLSHSRLFAELTPDNKHLYRGVAFAVRAARWAPPPMTAPRPGSDVRLPKTAPGTPPVPAPQVQGRDFSAPSCLSVTPAPTPRPVQTLAERIEVDFLGTAAPSPQPTSEPAQPTKRESATSLGACVPTWAVPTNSMPSLIEWANSKTCEELHAELLRGRRPAPTPPPFRASFDTDGRLVIHGAVPQADGSILLDKPEATKLRDLLAWRPL